ncbi:Egg protein, partial [Schistosoma japonicum]
YTSTQSDVQGHSYYTRYGRRKMMYELERPFLLNPDIGFRVAVHQFSYRSLLVLESGTFFMGSSFESGNRIRSIRIVGANMTNIYKFTLTFSSMVWVEWERMDICNLPSESYIFPFVRLHQNGTIQFHWWTSQPGNCSVIIEVSDGIYNGSADGRCRAQTSKVKCIAESTPNANCTWCTEFKRCIPSTSSCASEDQTATSQRNDGANAISTGVY